MPALDDTVTEPATFGQRLRRPEILLGAFAVELAVPALPEALALAGFDFVVIDTEHSTFGLDQVDWMVAAARASGIAPVVRVTDHSRGVLTRVADMSPDAIMVPGVASAEQAGAIVSLVKYAPLGERGVCPLVRHSRFPVESRFASINDRLALILQIEGRDGLREARAVAGVVGVDALFVGTYDLSQSLGLAGQLDHPEVMEAGRTLARELPSGTALGAYVSDGAMAGRWLEMGATFLTYQTDGQLLLGACRRAASDVAAAVNAAGSTGPCA